MVHGNLRIAVALLAAGCGEDPPELVPWGEIVFVRSHLDRSVLMTMDRDGTGLGPIYDGGGPPRVSADGRHVLWLQGGAAMVLTEGASEPVAIGGMDATSRWIEWAPVGARLAGVRNGTTLFVRDLDTGTELELALTSPRHRLVWSAQGRFLAYQDDGSVWVLDVDAGVADPLVSTAGPVELSWSPDEAMLAVGDRGTVFRVDLATSLAEPVIMVAEHDDAPPPRVQWSPDGAWIAWMDDFSWSSGGLVRPDGTDPTTLWGQLAGDPAWSPSSAWVAFWSNPDGHDCFHSECAALLAHAPGRGEDRYQAGLRDMAWAPDEDLLVAVHERLDEGFQPLPRRIAVYDVEADALTELGDLHPDDPREDSSPAWRPTPGPS